MGALLIAAACSQQPTQAAAQPSAAAAAAAAQPVPPRQPDERWIILRSSATRSDPPNPGVATTALVLDTHTHLLRECAMLIRVGSSREPGAQCVAYEPNSARRLPSGETYLYRAAEAEAPAGTHGVFWAVSRETGAVHVCAAGVENDRALRCYPARDSTADE